MFYVILGAPRLVLVLRTPFRPLPGETGSLNFWGRPEKISGAVRVYDRGSRILKFLGKVALLTRRVSQENPPCPAGPVRDRARGVSTPGTLIGGTGGGSLARSGPNC